jgi:hypothetical protein
LIEIVFYYQNSQKSPVHEQMIKSLANALGSLIELPKKLQVCLYPFLDNVYGGIDKNVTNRFGVNINLSLEQLPKIVVHELIHIHQRHVGLLKIKQGHYYWRNIPYSNKMPEEMSYQEYKSCPWETDVDERVDKLLTDSLELIKKQHLAKVDNKSA